MNIIIKTPSFRMESEVFKIPDGFISASILNSGESTIRLININNEEIHLAKGEAFDFPVMGFPYSNITVDPGVGGLVQIFYIS